MALDNAMNSLLHHYVDEVFLVALENDSEHKQAGGLLVCHAARLK